MLKSNKPQHPASATLGSEAAFAGLLKQHIMQRFISRQHAQVIAMANAHEVIPQVLDLAQ